MKRNIQLKQFSLSLFIFSLLMTLFTGCDGEKDLKIIDGNLPIKTSTLFMVGDATPNGWSIDDPTPFTQKADDPMLFTWEGTLNTGEMKLCLVAGSWDNPFIHPVNDQEIISKSNVSGQTFAMWAGAPDNKWRVTDAGKYRLTFDMRNWTINSEFLGELQKETHIYMIGDATAGGWAWDNAQEFTQDASNKDVFTWEGQLTEGTFKMSEEKDFNAPFYRPSSANVTVDASGVSASDMVFTASPDDQWKVTETGTYQITIDINNKTIKVVKK